jgi:hypothetical protein
VTVQTPLIQIIPTLLSPDEMIAVPVEGVMVVVVGAMASAAAIVQSADRLWLVNSYEG